MFKYSHTLFNKLLDTRKVMSEFPIMSVTITNDSKNAITVSKKNERESYIRMYDLDTQELVSSDIVGGKDDSYIKIKEVEQSDCGRIFAAAYFDDGHFCLRTVGEGFEKRDTRLNDQIGIDNWTMAINDFSDPYITCCFIGKKLFVQLFHNYSLTHYHFMFDLEIGKVIGKPV